MKTFTYGCTPKEILLSHLPDYYPMELVGEDKDIMIDVINQGIDSHLEACTDTAHNWLGNRLGLSISKNDMLVILRRLLESENENAFSLRTGILSTIGIEEI